MNRRVNWVLIALALVVPNRHAVAGSSPTIFRQPLDDVFITGYCGFPMEVRTTGSGVFHLFLDDQGNFERVIITAPRIRLSFTNLTTGASIWTPSVNMVEDTANPDGTGTQSLRGLLWRLVLPHEGLVTADVGRIDFLLTFDDEGNIIGSEVVFLAGQQEGQFEAALCSALS